MPRLPAALRGRRAARQVAGQQKDLPNQLYSTAGTRVSTPDFAIAGGGGVGVGNNSPFGNQFGAYADLLRNRVAQYWKTTDIRAANAPVVGVTFVLHRDGSATGIRITQKSGISALDISAQRAIMDAAPFPTIAAAVPQERGGDRILVSTEAVEDPRMKKLIGFAIALSGALCTPDRTGCPESRSSKEGGIPAIAIPDFRGRRRRPEVHGGVQRDSLRRRQVLRPSSRSFPRPRSRPSFPQQPSDFQPPAPPPAAAPRPRTQAGPAPVVPTNGGGRWMQDWSGPPVQANYLAFGYTAAQNGVLVLQGWLYDLSKDIRPTPRSSASATWARWTRPAPARWRTNSPPTSLRLFGGQSLFGTHIYFTSDRTGHKEIWVMDPDGKNQRQITRFNNISTYPTVSPDGTKVAFTSWVKGQPAIFIFSVDPVRDLRYYNQAASVNQAGSFTPDGKQIVYASSAGTGGVAGFSSRIWMERGFGRSLRQAPSKSSQKSIRRPGPISCSLRVAPVRNRFIG